MGGQGVEPSQMEVDGVAEALAVAVTVAERLDPLDLGVGRLGARVRDVRPRERYSHSRIASSLIAHATATRNELRCGGVNAWRCRCVMFPRRVSHRYRVFTSADIGRTSDRQRPRRGPSTRRPCLPMTRRSHRLVAGCGRTVSSGQVRSGSTGSGHSAGLWRRRGQFTWTPDYTNCASIISSTAGPLISTLVVRRQGAYPQPLHTENLFLDRPASSSVRLLTVTACSAPRSLLSGRWEPSGWPFACSGVHGRSGRPQTAPVRLRRPPSTTRRR